MSHPRRRVLLPLGFCAALLLLHAALAWTAIAPRCATYDEPLHAVAGYTHLWLDDYRMDPENPPLFEYWAALAQPRRLIDPAQDPSDWRRLLTDHRACDPFIRAVLYDTPDNPAAAAPSPRRIDADAFINRSRAMMLLVSLALAATLATTACKLAGPTAAGNAAVIAAALYCLDPNFLAHGPLVKNDVSFAFAYFLLALALWQLGRRLTPLRLLATAAALTACLTIKFTGLLAAALVPLALLTRAALPTPWPRALSPRSPSFIVHRSSLIVSSLLASAVILLLAYAGIWATYRFRFAPTLDPAQRLSYDVIRTKTAVAQYMAAHAGQFPTNEQVTQLLANPDLTTRLVLFADAHRLLPQHYLNGFLLVRAGVTVRYGYLLGQRSLTGWWYYFPCAIAFKTPTATLAALLLALSLFARQLLRNLHHNPITSPNTHHRARPPRFSGSEQPPATASEPTPDTQPKAPASSPPTPTLWTLLAFTLPFALYLLSALTAHIDIGLRHVFPLYPFLYLFTATTLARAMNSSRRSCFILLPTSFCLLILLLAETLPAYPDFLSFFNTPSRLLSSPLHLLSDSNLDWGQDLKRLVAWQHAHPHTPLYLCYYGSVPPQYYGLRFTPLPGNFPLPGPDFPTSPPGVLAISATNLQGVYFTDNLRQAYAPLQHRPPLTHLGTLYLYPYP